ncbi:hypothetical protein [Agaribacter flavus]|uniref:Uncharacterized protein n=1 Tax=Agaribacter flavus TaxID=1902781 RepID=A0ABV7FQA9_9ALTE
MNESDWKIFKQIKDLAIEKYCSLTLDEANDIISGERESSHETYLYLYKTLQNRDKHLAVMFEGHSRSKAWLQLIAMRKEGLAEQSLLDKLSDEFRIKTDPTKLW